MLAGDVGDGLAEDPQRGRHLRLADRQGRRHPDARLAALEDEQAPLEGGPLDLLGVLGACRTRSRASGPGRGRRGRGRRTRSQRREPGERLLAAGARRCRRGRPRAGRSSRGPRRRRPGCRRTSSHGRPGPQASSRSARATSAPSGIPRAMPLAVSTMSGFTPQCSTAHIVPVRPAPDWISSATSRIPWRSQISRRPARKPSSGTT